MKIDAHRWNPWGRRKLCQVCYYWRGKKPGARLARNVSRKTDRCLISLSCVQCGFCFAKLTSAVIMQAPRRHRSSVPRLSTARCPFRMLHLLSLSCGAPFKLPRLRTESTSVLGTMAVWRPTAYSRATRGALGGMALESSTKDGDVRPPAPQSTIGNMGVHRSANPFEENVSLPK